MNKIYLSAVFGIALLLVMSSFVMAIPAKSLFDGKTAGNTGFTNIVGNNADSDISGWVRYSKNSKSLHTTWVIDGLEPNTEYQLKLHTKTGDDRIDQACDFPETGAIWQCGDWGTEGFLVMATVTSNAQGKVNYAVKEDRLETGTYDGDNQFIITQNSNPWASGWTWENPENSVFSIK